MITRVWVHDNGAMLAVEMDDGDGGLSILDLTQSPVGEIAVAELDLTAWNEMRPT